MQEDPSSMFAALLRSCINDEYDAKKSLAKDSLVVFVIGIGSSVLTTYLLSQLGFFV
jgi:hypothetical protein